MRTLKISAQTYSELPLDCVTRCDSRRNRSPEYLGVLEEGPYSADDMHYSAIDTNQIRCTPCGTNALTVLSHKLGMRTMDTPDARSLQFDRTFEYILQEGIVWRDAKNLLNSTQ